MPRGGVLYLNVEALGDLGSTRGDAIMNYVVECGALVVALVDVAFRTTDSLCWVGGGGARFVGVYCQGPHERGGVALLWRDSIQGQAEDPMLLLPPTTEEERVLGEMPHRRLWVRLASRDLRPLYICVVYLRPRSNAQSCAGGRGNPRREELSFLQHLRRECHALRILFGSCPIVVGGDFNCAMKGGGALCSRSDAIWREVIEHCGLHLHPCMSPTYCPTKGPNVGTRSLLDAVFSSLSYDDPVVVLYDLVAEGVTDHAGLLLSLPLDRRKGAAPSRALHPHLPCWSDASWRTHRRAVSQLPFALSGAPAQDAVSLMGHVRSCADSILQGGRKWLRVPRRERIPPAVASFRRAWKQLLAAELHLPQGHATTAVCRERWIEARRERNRLVVPRRVMLCERIARLVEERIRHLDPYGGWKTIAWLSGDQTVARGVPPVMVCEPDGTPSYYKSLRQLYTRTAPLVPPTPEIQRVWERLAAVAATYEATCDFTHALDLPLSQSELSTAMGRLHLHRARGTDGLPSDLYRAVGSDPESIALLVTLLPIVNAMWMASEWPASFNEVRVIPLLKKPHLDPTSSSSYRALCAPNGLAKLLSLCVQQRLELWLEGRCILPQEQTGFRRHMSTEDDHIVMRILLQGCRRREMPLQVCFIDVKQAYDTVRHDLLLGRLADLGMPKRLFSFISRWITSGELILEGSVLADGVTPSPALPRILQLRGLPQGGIFSPTLYSVYVSDVPRDLYAAAGPNGGVRLYDILQQTSPIAPLPLDDSDEEEVLSCAPCGGEAQSRADPLVADADADDALNWAFLLLFIVILMYADDIALVSSTREGMQRLLDGCTRHSRLWDYQFNQGPGKTELLTLYDPDGSQRHGKAVSSVCPPLQDATTSSPMPAHNPSFPPVGVVARVSGPPPPLQLCDEMVLVCEKYRYLGYFMEEDVVNGETSSSQSVARLFIAAKRVDRIIAMSVLTAARIMMVWCAIVAPNAEYLCAVWPAGRRVVEDGGSKVLRTASTLLHKALRDIAFIGRGPHVRVRSQDLMAEWGLEPLWIRAVQAKARLLWACLQYPEVKVLAYSAILADFRDLVAICMSGKLPPLRGNSSKEPWSLELLLGLSRLQLVPPLPTNRSEMGPWAEASSALVMQRLGSARSGSEVKQWLRLAWSRLWKAARSEEPWSGVLIRDVPCKALAADEYPKSALYLHAGTPRTLFHLMWLRLAQRLPPADAVKWWRRERYPPSSMLIRRPEEVEDDAGTGVDDDCTSDAPILSSAPAAMPALGQVEQGGAPGGEQCCILCGMAISPTAAGHHWSHILCVCPVLSAARGELLSRLLSTWRLRRVWFALSARLGATLPPMGPDLVPSGCVRLDEAWAPALLVASSVEREPTGKEVLWHRSVRRLPNGRVRAVVRLSAWGREWCLAAAGFARAVVEAVRCC